MGALIWIIVIGTSIWVLIDAKTIGVKNGEDMGPWGWFFVCLLLWIVGFPFYLAKRRAWKRINMEKVNPPTLQQPHQPGTTTKSCPFCGEQIMEAAIKCKHCGEMLSQGTSCEQAKGTSNARKVCKWIIIIWSAFCLVGVVVGIGNVGKELNEGMNEFEQAGASLGIGCGLAIWIIVWAVIALPTLIIWLVAWKKTE